MFTPKNPNRSYINENGKLVSGAAAHLNYVYTVKGSVQNYNDEVGTEYITEFIKQNSDIINENLTKKAKKNRFKVV